MILGLIVGVLNFLCTTIIAKLIPLLKCQNYQNQRVLMMAFIFLFCFTNTAVIPQLTTNFDRDKWLNIFGKTIYVGMITTSILPFILPLLGILIKKGCKKKPLPIML